MGTGLTGGFASLQADLQQIGNIAPTVGSKISAFSGKTSIGVQQVAQSLTSFSGKSAQTWQSYNASHHPGELVHRQPAHRSCRRGGHPGAVPEFHRQRRRGTPPVRAVLLGCPE